MISDILLAVDMFGVKPTFQVKDGVSYNTLLGGVCSLTIISITLIYALFKLLLLIERGETNHMTVEDDTGLEGDRLFSNAVDGFDIAFGLQLPKVFKSVPEESIGTWHVKLLSYAGESEDYESEELPIHRCTPEEKVNFNPKEINKLLANGFTFEQLWCVDEPELLELQGNAASSENFKILAVEFNECQAPVSSIYGAENTNEGDLEPFESFEFDYYVPLW